METSPWCSSPSLHSLLLVNYHHQGRVSLVPRPRPCLTNTWVPSLGSRPRRTTLSVNKLCKESLLFISPNKACMWIKLLLPQFKVIAMKVIVVRWCQLVMMDLRISTSRDPPTRKSHWGPRMGTTKTYRIPQPCVEISFLHPLTQKVAWFPPYRVTGASTVVNHYTSLSFPLWNHLSSYIPYFKLPNHYYY